MKPLFFAFLLVCSLLSACSQSSQQVDAIDAFPRALPENSDSEMLNQFQPPQQLGEFLFQGSITFPDKLDRVFRYRHQANDEYNLSMAVYPLPPGWNNLPPSRTIQGHYGMIRQRIMQRSIDKGASESYASDQEILVLDELVYPVATCVIHSSFPNYELLTRVYLSAESPFFVRATISGDSEAFNMLSRQSRQAMIELAQSLRKQMKKP